MLTRRSPCSPASAPSLLRRFLGLALALLVLLPVVAEAKKDEKEKKLRRKQIEAMVEKLPEKYQRWLLAVELLIAYEEKVAFLGLEKDYQRDAFIERFWSERDPYPRSGRNELRDDYEARMDHALQEFGSLDDDRARVFLINGPPPTRLEIDNCEPFYPLEVWFYKGGSDKFQMDFLLLFYQRFGMRGAFRLWEPLDGMQALFDSAPSAAWDGSSNPLGRQGRCGEEGDAIRAAIAFLSNQGGQAGAGMFFERLLSPPVEAPAEWVATFAAYSTDLPAEAGTFAAELAIDYVGRHQSRTILQGAVAVEVAELGKSTLDLYAAYNLLLNGEILRDDTLFDSFRYKFDFPENEVRDGAVPLVFQRYLRPGEYRLILRVEDVATGRFYREERALQVPQMAATAPAPADPETARLLEEANAAIRSGETTIKLMPMTGEWQTGLVRIDTFTTGPGLAKVRFVLDDQPILTKKNPPYNVELDLGEVPRSRVLRVEAYDDKGEEVASDEVMLNSGRHRFAVRLEEPRRGKRYVNSLRAEVDVIVPEDEVVQRVELYLNETLVSTLYQPPWTQPIILPPGEPTAYVRAVAYTPDGRATEDLVFINAPANLEEIDVDFVELYTLVLDRQNHPVEGLDRGDFTVLEDGVPQEVVRFEMVRDLPIHAAVMLDISASMEGRIQQTQEAALHFFQQAIRPKDRAAIITFNDHPNLAAKLTNDVDQLASGLAGIKAERGTALYDSIIFSLYYFNGLKGQKAIVLLSDGKDESSRFSFDDALEYAHRAGVSIYSIGLDLDRGEGDAKRKLTRLAEETGGRSFFVEGVDELEMVYDTIQRELRSRYLIAYQSTNTSDSKRFRSIEIQTAKGLEAKSLRGYYP